MRGLTSHVLDTLHGTPARGVVVALYVCAANTPPQLLKETSTDTHGRCHLAEVLAVGTYELQFAIGDYFRHHIPTLPEPAFLDRVTVRFSVADAARHYHIPLVASPWSYSTYKGGAPANDDRKAKE